MNEKYDDCFDKNAKFSKALMNPRVAQTQNEHNNENKKNLQVENYACTIILVYIKC